MLLQKKILSAAWSFLTPPKEMLSSCTVMQWQNCGTGNLYLYYLCSFAVCVCIFLPGLFCSAYSFPSLFLHPGLPHSRCRICHFPLLNFTWLVIAQPSHLWRSLCRVSLPLRESICRGAPARSSQLQQPGLPVTPGASVDIEYTCVEKEKEHWCAYREIHLFCYSNTLLNLN